jgi:hypothetical protein
MGEVKSLLSFLGDSLQSILFFEKRILHYQTDYVTSGSVRLGVNSQMFGSAAGCLRRRVRIHPLFLS